MVDNKYIYRVPPTNIIVIHLSGARQQPFFFSFFFFTSLQRRCLLLFFPHLARSCRIHTEVGCSIHKLIVLSVNKPRNLYKYIHQKNRTIMAKDGLAEPFR
jgi:hypothetical protein